MIYMKLLQSPSNFSNKKIINKDMGKRNYSTDSRKLNLPIPISIISNLGNNNNLLLYRKLIDHKGGIYSFVNKINGKQYIGSAKNFYLRLNEHLSQKKSNSALQAAIVKYGLDNFDIYIYEFFSYEKKLASAKLLTDLETMYIKKFEFSSLYNFMSSATNSEGYKHTDEAKRKMVKRLENKENHPF